MGDPLGENQVGKTIEDFIVMPLIIIIGLYMMASAIVPFINLDNQNFSIIFTLSGGIPTLTFFFKSKMRKP
jgi:hypothetical protein